MGLASALAMWGLHRWGRRNANAHLATHGVLVQAEILRSELHTGRFAWTEVTYTYLPEGAARPLTVTRKLDGGVRFQPGERVAVRYLRAHPFVSVLVGHESRHDAS